MSDPQDLPQSLECERAVLGAILLDPAAAFPPVLPILKAEDFFDEKKARIYGGMLDLFKRSGAVDELTLKEELNGGGRETVDASYLAWLADKLPDIGNAEQWARIVKEKAELRRLIRVGQRIVQGALSQEQDAAALVADAVPELQVIGQAAQERLEGWLSPAAVLRACPRPKARFASTLAAINKAAAGGLPTGALIVYIGIPDAGKTGIVIQDAVEIALRHEAVVVVFTPDQGREATALRAGALLGLDQGRLEERNEDELARFEEVLRNRRILLPDDCAEENTTENVIAVAEKIRPDLPHVLALDSLQEARAHGKPGDDSGEKDNVIANIRACRRATTSSAVAWLVLATSQTTKASQSRDPKSRPPAIMAGADSAKIGFATQLIVYLEGDPSLAPNYARATVVKSKLRGPKGNFGLRLDPVTTRLSEIDQPEADLEKVQQAERKLEQEVGKLADRIIALLRKHGPLNRSEILERVGGKGERLGQALDGLEAQGAATWHKGPHNSHIWEAVVRGTGSPGGARTASEGA